MVGGPKHGDPLVKGNVTELLAAYRGGDDEALDQAFQLIYGELRKLARYQLRGQPNNTLNTTALVHELYLKVAGGSEQKLVDRGHFLALASRAMRQIVVDYARIRSAQKRGGGARAVTLEDRHMSVDDQAEWILTVDKTLQELREQDERMEQVFECRYFAGFTEQETATALGIPLRTVQRDWRRAKGWLQEKLK